MRNLLAFIKQEFGEESVLKLHLWEKTEKKMANFRNHRRFSIKCLKRRDHTSEYQAKDTVFILERPQKLLEEQKNSC